MSVITSPFGYTSSAAEVAAGHDLTGQTVLVTGATSGIGRETARVLASIGATLILPVRDPARGEAAAAAIRESVAHASIDVRELNLGSLASVKSLTDRLGDDYERIDIVINNAGVMATPFEHTIDGFEMQFGTNHLGHFGLFVGLLPLLAGAKSPRVVALSSIAHRMSDVDFDDIGFERRPYDKWVAYGQSKTACALFAVAVAANSGIEAVRAFAVHPGGIMTGLQKFLPREEMEAFGWIDAAGKVNELFKSVEQGASTSVWAALGEELNGATGLYLENCQQAAPWTKEMPMMGVRDYALSPSNAQRLWDLSMELVAPHL